MDKIKFAHLADLHLGSFREKKLTNLNFESFRRAIDRVIISECEFVIFAGDIFNNAMPPIEIVTRFVSEINRLRERGIELYVIGGSHDFSDSGKSYIELLDKTGVLCDVSKVKLLPNRNYELDCVVNQKLKLNIVGVGGRKKGLDKVVYDRLERVELKKDWLNVFVFHTTLSDFKPASLNVKSEVGLGNLPKGFDYYAGGHIHHSMLGNVGGASGGKVSYSGCLFPNNFSEFIAEEATFNICEFDFESRKLDVEKVVLDVYSKEYVKINVDGMNPVEARAKIVESLLDLDVDGRIVLLEVVGTVEGKITDIGINVVVSDLYDRGAYVVLKNTYKLKTKLLERVEVSEGGDALEVEREIVEKYLNEFSGDRDRALKIIRGLLDKEFVKAEGETNAQFEERVISEFEGVMK